MVMNWIGRGFKNERSPYSQTEERGKTPLCQIMLWPVAGQNKITWGRHSTEALAAAGWML